MGMMRDEQAFVIVDLRPASEARKGHIKGAVTVPSDKLADSKAMFPEDKSAPVILYDGAGMDAEAFKAVRGWGYKNASVLAGGTKAWLDAKGRLFEGALETKIAYVKTLPKGQVSIEEFDQVIKTQPADKIILDVRDASTAAQGMLKGAVLIPQGELEGRLAELPKDKEILIHCNTGILASMAHKTLQNAGYRSRYLDAVIQVAKDGSYEIVEK